MRGIEIASCRSLDLLAPGEANVGVQADGEHAGFLPASVEMARDALTLLAPPALR
jgi:diacylglycerol kinase family enzyme